MEDDRVSILEAQLAQAKLIAEEADKKYEEVSALMVVESEFFLIQRKFTFFKFNNLVLVHCASKTWFEKFL